MPAGDSPAPLIDFRPPGGNTDPDAIMDAFLEAMIARNLDLYPAQEEAILEVMAGKHVILNTPTGSGKSLVALAVHFKALCEGKRAYYTSPIKALVSEKFFDLCNELGAESVGMLTGDASINRDAPIVCCTAEILSNIALREGEHADCDYAVLDEFHYFSDRDRGVAWQLPLLTLPRARFLLMSATLGDVRPIAEKLTKLTDAEVAHVKTNERPVPLDFNYRTTPIHETIDELISSNRAPVYVVNFTQRECAEQAQNLCSVNFTTKEHKKRIQEAVGGFKFDSTYGKDMRRFISHGIGLHHAGLLPKYRLLVERLSQQGLLKIICGTDTLGVGVNVPIRTVLFTKLCKYDGEKTTILSVRDFKQISGRAGRKGYDDAGSVVCQAPEHVIENLRMEQKYSAGEDPNDKKTAKKRKKQVKKKPPDRGFVHWDEQTFERLQRSDPEDLRSSFQVGHGMLLNLVQGHDDGWDRLHRLIDESFEVDARKEKLHRRAEVLLASLEDAGLCRVSRQSDGTIATIDVDSDLQLEFALNQTLSLYLVETLPLLEPDSETYALDVLSLVEAILESPRVILLRQVDKLKGDKVAELKAAGVEYDQRMEELEKIEHPKPLRDFIYSTFNEFARLHPWVGEENIRPKSIAREMVERFMTFADYIKEYQLSRSEGLLLRQLNQTYRTLTGNVPVQHQTDEVLEIAAFLRTALSRADSSLLEEWESLRAPEDEDEGQARPPTPFDVTRDEKAFRALVRAELHGLVKALSERDWETAASQVRQDPDDPWSEQRFEDAMAPFFEEYGRLLFDHTARLPPRTRLVKTGEKTWEATQVLCDPEGNDDWSVSCVIELDGWTPDTPLIRVVRAGL